GGRRAAGRCRGVGEGDREVAHLADAALAKVLELHESSVDVEAAAWRLAAFHAASEDEGDGAGAASGNDRGGIDAAASILAVDRNALHGIGLGAVLLGAVSVAVVIDDSHGFAEVVHDHRRWAGVADGGRDRDLHGSGFWPT